MKKPNNRLRLKHILSAISQVEKHVDGFDVEEFRRDERTLSAVLWQLIVVGKATSHLTLELKDSNAHVQWQSASAARNRLVHGYFDIDPEIIWDIVTNDLPFLRLQVEKILEEIEI